MRTIASLTLLAVFVTLGCDGRVARAPANVRVFITQGARGGDDGRPDLKGTFLWPVDQKLGKYQLAHVADPLFSLEPSWGSYSGVGQSIVNESNVQTHLDVDLTSIESIPHFVRFCRALGHKNGVVFVYRGREGISSPRIENVVGVYPESAFPEQVGPSNGRQPVSPEATSVPAAAGVRR